MHPNCDEKESIIIMHISSQEAHLKSKRVIQAKVMSNFLGVKVAQTSFYKGH